MDIDKSKNSKLKFLHVCFPGYVNAVYETEATENFLIVVMNYSPVQTEAIRRERSLHFSKIESASVVNAHIEILQVRSLAQDY